MAVCQATGREMAVCQAMGHEIAVCLAKARRPSDFGHVLRPELGKSRLGGGQAPGPPISVLTIRFSQLAPDASRLSKKIIHLNSIAWRASSVAMCSHWGI